MTPSEIAALLGDRVAHSVVIRDGVPHPSMCEFYWQHCREAGCKFFASKRAPLETRTQIRGVMAHAFGQWVAVGLRGGGLGPHIQTEAIWTFASIEDLLREYGASEYLSGRVNTTEDREVSRVP